MRTALLFFLVASLPACSDSRAAEVAPAARDPDPPAVAQPPPAIDARIVISAVGDVTLGADVESRNGPGSFALVLADHGGDMAYPFSGVEPILAGDDLTIANLETTLTDAPPPPKAGAFQFNGSPEYAKVLVLGSVELVNVANNHSHDMGERGYRDTLASVRSENVGAFGNGEIDRRVVKGVEIVDLGFTGGDIKVLPGVVREIKKAKTDRNLVLVSFHWGIEGSAAPNDVQLKLGHAAVDAGADLVIGTHPHVLEGIEEYKGKHILYSLGNFVFGGNSHPADKDSIIYQEVFSTGDAPRPVESRVLPVSISTSPVGNDYRPIALAGAEKDRVLAKLDAMKLPR